MKAFSALLLFLFLYPTHAQKPSNIKLKRICALDGAVAETSGLILIHDTLWTLNDGGNDAAIYAIDTCNGSVISRIVFPGLKNNDWEEISADSNTLFIGDFGDNFSTRTDQQILIIENGTRSPLIPTGSICFHFADQAAIPEKKRHSDCEAMISFGDSLMLFGKSPGSLRAYMLPKIAGNYSIYPQNSLFIRGLITGAAWDDENNTLILTGYRRFIPFVYIISTSNPSQISKRSIRKKWFLFRAGRQIEAVSISGRGRAWISSEKAWILRTRLFELRWRTK